jgi:ATP-binding cassette subfamily B protein
MPTLYTSQPGKLESFLRNIPLFHDLEQESLSALAKGASVLSYPLGETVIREGDTADALYVIVKGSIRAVSAPDRADPNREVSLTKLGPGDHFGEVGLIERGPRIATCRVAGEQPAFVVKIAGGAVAPVIESHPRLRDTILKLGDLYRAWNFLKIHTTIPEAMTPEQLRDFVGLLELRTFAKEETIVRAGDPDPPFVMIRSGFVRIVEQDRPQGVLGEGRYFGETEALRGEKAARALVAAADEVEVFLLPRLAFLGFVNAVPAVRAFFEWNPCRPVDASLVTTPPRSYNVKDEDPTVYLGLEAVPLKRQSPTPESSGLRRLDRPRQIHRFPFVRQHDETDCGSAALGMVARFHGKRVGVGRIRDLARASAEGASLGGLAEAADALGFIARGARVSADALDGKPLPAIAHWGESHFVVLYRLDAKAAWIADPAIGLRRLTREELEASYSGSLLLLDPTERLAGTRESKGGLRRFLEQLAPYKLLVLEIALASLLVDAFSLALPLATQAILDHAIPSGRASMVTLLVGGLAVLAIFRVLTQAIRAHLVTSLTLRLDLRILLKFFFHVLALPLGFFRLRRPGEVLGRFAENAKLRSVLAGSAIAAFLDAGLVVLTVVVMFLESRKLTVAVLAFVPLVAIVALVFTPFLRRRSERVLEANAEQESLLVDTVTAIETVKALAVERPTRWRWEGLYTRYLKALEGAARLEIALASLTEALVAASSLVLLGYGAMLVLGNELTIGQLVAFQALLGGMLVPVGNLVAFWDRIQGATLSLERVDSVLDCEPEESAGPSSLVDPKALLKGRVRFERVFFRYAAAAPFAVEDLSFEIQAGKTVAIVGRSGSGKSTAARLLLKLDLPTEGHVTIDDLDLVSISAHGLRRSVGFVPQEVHIFQGTIAENIALGAEDVDRPRLEESARIADAHSFISSLPQGYDTLLGERGMGLSAGQRQRIAIARALYHRPRILVLDEATASLDVESEERILLNLKDAASGRTVVILSHRTGVARRADRIFVLERGRLVEQGTHEELLRAAGVYHDLEGARPR